MFSDKDDQKKKKSFKEMIDERRKAEGGVDKEMGEVASVKRGSANLKKKTPSADVPDINAAGVKGAAEQKANQKKTSMTIDQLKKSIADIFGSSIPESLKEKKPVKK